jgi:hypothetical protein
MRTANGILQWRSVNNYVVEMCSGRRLPGVLLRNLLALGKCPSADVRIMRLAGGPDVIRITARTALHGKLGHVGTLICHPIAMSATPLALAIGKERVERMPRSHTF